VLLIKSPPGEQRLLLLIFVGDFQLVGFGGRFLPGIADRARLQLVLQPFVLPAQITLNLYRPATASLATGILSQFLAHLRSSRPIYATWLQRCPLLQSLNFFLMSDTVVAIAENHDPAGPVVVELALAKSHRFLLGGRQTSQRAGHKPPF
jgi:hypothetical protein